MSSLWSLLFDTEVFLEPINSWILHLAKMLSFFVLLYPLSSLPRCVCFLWMYSTNSSLCLCLCCQTWAVSHRKPLSPTPCVFSIMKCFAFPHPCKYSSEITSAAVLSEGVQRTKPPFSAIWYLSLLWIPKFESLTMDDRNNPARLQEEGKSKQVVLLKVQIIIKSKGLRWNPK